MVGRNWIKMRFLDAEDAVSARKRLSVLTYRLYYNGFFLKMFSLA
jgi:hypothetical protein